MDLDFHNTRWVLYPDTQPNGLRYGRGIFLEDRASAGVSKTHTQLSLCDTPKPDVPRVH